MYLGVIEALVREVLSLLIHLMRCRLSLDHHGIVIPDKVIMRKAGIMIQIDKDSCVCDKATCNEWISEAIQRHGPVIKTKKLIKVDFTLLNFFLISLPTALKGSHFKDTIIIKDSCKELPIWRLLKLLHLDIASFKLFRK